MLENPLAVAYTYRTPERAGCDHGTSGFLPALHVGSRQLQVFIQLSVADGCKVNFGHRVLWPVFPFVWFVAASFLLGVRGRGVQYFGIIRL